MMPERAVTLPHVPASIADAHGHPHFGTFRGELDEVGLGALRGPYSLPAPLRWVKHKKWFYAQVVTGEVVAVFGIVDLGYTSKAFVSVLDLRSQVAVFDEGLLGLPGTRVRVGERPGSGCSTSFKRPGARLCVHRAPGSGRYELDLELRPLLPFGQRLRWEGALDAGGAADALTVISPVPDDGLVNVTQKRAALKASGRLELGERSYSLEGGTAGLDYTCGYLARHTAWRWAMGNGRLADGTPFGFNLVDGINDTNPRCNENGLWVGGQLYPVGRARFSFQKEHPEAAWTVETADGALALSFQPLHLHRDHRDYKVLRSHFVQPLGLFSGTLRAGGRTLEVKNVGGVTEDQDILW